MRTFQTKPDQLREHEREAEQITEQFESIVLKYRELFDKHDRLGVLALDEYSEGFEKALAQLDSALEFFKSYCLS